MRQAMVKMESVWQRTAEFLSDNVTVVLPIAIAAIFVPTTISQAVQPLHADSGQALQVVLAILTLIFTLLSIWGQAAIMALAIDPTIGRSAARTGARRMPAIIGTGLLLLLALLVLLLPIYLVLAPDGAGAWTLASGNAKPSPAAMAAIVLYAIVLIVILVIAFARLVLITPVIVAERRGIGAIRRSWRLTRGRTAAMVGLILLYAVIVIVAQLAAKTVLGSVLLLIFGGDGVINVATVLTAIGVGLVIMIFTVLQAAFLAKLYVALADPAELNAAVPA
ncbi:hypothetical protein KY084_02890 [Stakelama sp. CBK3Z-3]|uniref:Glycerophosphoryl diester phosphodiesterase membrane domain-containing protein n=1 Tax=Stakelama flava TaxID=2860338 RepID=A0ABS6XK95_9SPHN|nr:hypothetical protein [Stakelama flava]MBW4329821.1 hypothetical protein [Stakelama flava]